MPASQIPVLLAVRDMGPSVSVASAALMEAGAAVSLIRVRSTEHLLDRLMENTPSLLVLELDGEWSVLEGLRTRHPQLPVVVIVAHSTEEMAFALSRLQVEDVWISPLEESSTADRAQAVFERVRRLEETGRNRQSVLLPEIPVAAQSTNVTIAAPKGENEPISPPVMMGDNPGMAEIRDTIEKVSGTDVTVLIRGESGVGKEVVARLLFEHSRRRLKPFVKVNCAAIPNDLLESELFGYEAGAFTGAVRSKPGKFELADHGTLFLDEIAEMHPSLQAKLLHVLQDGKFSRLGAKKDVSVDVRVICATNKLLEERVREGLFREDLLYRINVVTIFLPPLRERRDEIPILTDYLLRKYSAQYGRELHPLGAEVTRRMMGYDWPGNIRELENLCKRFVLVGNETQILRELSGRTVAKVIPTPKEAISGPPQQEKSNAATTPDAASLLEIGRRAAWEAERHAILEMLEATRWNRREASRRLQISYKALLNKIKQMNLEGNAPAESLPPGKMYGK
ncbi:MAG TPA: sigma-54 dependent transcriptional regulator [Acidobacteriaceae bacterium]|nr:sigma-54 dependent transcriptional regulator [Acidobacteriaceae bacterium]